MAIIFLCATAAAAKLFFLQVKDHIRFSALAQEQHEAMSEFEPERGKILIEEAGGEDYPIAMNMKLADIFVQPDRVPESERLRVAEALYAAIDEPYFTYSQAKAASSTQVAGAEETLALENYHRERFKAEKIAAYLQALMKSGDPYEVIAKKAGESAAARVRELDLPGVGINYGSHRYYPERLVGTQLIGFVGFSGDRKIGRYGLEGFFEEELSGKKGYLKGERDANGRMIILADMQEEKLQDGCDLVLTLRRNIQYESCKKLKESVEKHGATGGSVIVIEPATGQIIAMCSYPDYDPNDYEDVQDIKLFNNPAIFGQYEPGSVFKPITMAAALDQGKVAPHTTYIDKGSIMIKGWPKPIKNSDFETHGGHGRVTMAGVLENSLNTGAIFAMESIGPFKFAEYLKSFGFGEKTGIELETESKGDLRNLLTKNVREINAATASFGQGITVTPLQMAVSYAVIANGGMLMKPYIVKSIACSGRPAQDTSPTQVRRVISQKTASLLSAMMVGVVENGHAKRAQIKGYWVAGKTGTAQVPSPQGGYSEETIHTFIGFAPVSDPQFVMLTKIDAPKDAKFAESTAVPLFGELAPFVLQQLKVPQERR